MVEPAADMLSERARRVLDIAAEVARHFGVQQTYGEHILIALALVWDGLAARTLLTFNLDDKVLYEDLRRLEENVYRPAPVRLNSSAERALDPAMSEAKRLGSNQVDSEHLLLGVAAVEGLAADILAYHHVDAVMVRAEIDRLLAAQQ